MKKPRICKLKIVCNRTNITKNNSNCINNVLINSELIPDNGYAYQYPEIIKRCEANETQYDTSTEENDIFEIPYINYTLCENIHKVYFQKLFTGGCYCSRNEIAEIFSTIIGEKVIAAMTDNCIFLDSWNITQGFSKPSFKVQLLLQKNAKFLASKTITRPIIADAQDLAVFDSLMIPTLNNALSEMFIQIHKTYKCNDVIKIKLNNTYRFKEEVEKFLSNHKNELLQFMFDGKFKEFLTNSNLSLEEKWIDTIIENINSAPVLIAKGENNETK